MWSGRSISELLTLVAKQQDDIVRLRQEQEQFVRKVESKLDALVEGQAASKEQGTYKLTHTHILTHSLSLMHTLHTHTSDAKMESMLRERQSLDKPRTDKIASTLSTSLTNTVKNRLDYLFKSEMKNIVLPCELMAS